MKNQTTNAVSTPATTIKVDEEFKVGTVYEDFTCGKGYTSYKVTARTAKFVTVANLTDGTEKRCKIDFEQKKYYANGYHTVEFISPDKKANGFSASDIDHKAMQQIKAALVEDIANEYAVSPEAQDAAVDAEVEQAAVTVNAEIKIDGYDETAFDLLPIITDEEEELREYLYDFDEKQEVLADKYEVNAPAKLADTNKISEEPETARPAWWPTLGEFQYQLTLANKRLASLQKSLDINESFLRDISPEEYGMDYIKTVNGAHEINAYLHEDIKRAKENVADIEEKITELVSEIADECAVTAEAQDAAVDAEVEQAAVTVNAEIKIETKIAKNGAASVYINGKRVNRENAVKFAEENGLPIYKAIRYTYGGSAINEYFATALSAYKWAIQQDCESNEVIRFTGKFENVTTIYESTPNDEEINADDEPEFATFVYAKTSGELISNRYASMMQYFNQLVKDGLTEEQAEQVITVYAGNRNGLAHLKLAEEFKAQDAAVEAEIEQTANAVVEVSEEPKTVERVCVTIAVKDSFDPDDEDTHELFAKLERDIEWLPDIIRYHVDPEDGISVTANDDAAIRATEMLFDRYGLDYSHHVFHEKITATDNAPDTPDTLAEVEQATGTVAEIKIETKISANGTANVYVNGKRTSREAAVKFAEENNLPTYTAICYPYSERNYSISEEFATALSAYKWIVSKANSNRNVADGSFEIRRYTDGIKNETTIFDYTENGDEKINADDEPEFATFIYAEIGEVHISERYDRMVLFHNQLANDGLTEEQINQVLVTQYNNENGREHCKLIKEFKAQNGIVEVKPSMINRSEEPDTTAEIELAANTPAPEASILEHMNSNAPEGWAVIRDKEKLRVEYQGKFVADAERVTDRDLIVPQAFFRQFEPLIDKSKTPAQIFLDDRYRELAELEEMRKSPDCTPAAIKTLDEMIDRLKRDIVDAEFYERDTVAAACKAGIFDENGNLMF